MADENRRGPESRICPGPVAIRAAANGDPVPRLIEGYASVYYDGSAATEFELWPGVVERVAPGAWKRAAAEDDIRALFNHDPSLILGRSASKTAVYKSDDVGLAYSVREADTTVWRDLAIHLDRGDVSGSSISFGVTDERWFVEGEGRDAIDVREILDAVLWDAGPVTFPAFEGTSSGLRSAEAGLADLRRSWAAWKSVEEDEAAVRRATAVASRLRARRARVVSVLSG